MINIIGTMKDVLLTYAGFAVFQDTQYSPTVLAGLAISFAGSCYAIHTKIGLVKQERQRAKDEIKKTK